MNNLVSSITKTPTPKDLEELLLDFLKYGEPMLYKMDGGWYCKIEMRVMSAGATFDVKSKHDNKTPLDAVVQCRERMFKALGDLS